jgi:hypothetical protein
MFSSFWDKTCNVSNKARILVSALNRQHVSCYIRWCTKSFRTGLLERELQMVQFSATRCSCIAILWVSLVSFVAITLCVASQWVFIVVAYFVIYSVRKLFDTSSYSPMLPFIFVWVDYLKYTTENKTVITKCTFCWFLCGVVQRNECRVHNKKRHNWCST